MRRGRLFVIEGGDGAGKTSLCKSLSQALDPERAEFFREPGGTNLGDLLRGALLSMEDISPVSQLLLFMAARFQLIDKFVLPAIREGRDVFLDRFDASTYAYQICGNNQPGLEEVFFHLRRQYLAILGDGGGFQPEYIWLNVDPAIASERMKRNGRETNHLDRMEIPFHQRVRAGYETFFNRYAKQKIVIDANQSEDDVFRAVSEIVSPGVSVR